MFILRLRSLVAVAAAALAIAAPAADAAYVAAAAPFDDPPLLAVGPGSNLPPRRGRRAPPFSGDRDGAPVPLRLRVRFGVLHPSLQERHPSPPTGPSARSGPGTRS